VTGETQVPQAQVIQSDRGLVLSLTPATDTTADLPQRSTQPPASSPSEEPVEPEAEPTEQPAAEGEEEVEITVTATRTEEEPQDVPRSVTVINREQVEQQTRLSRDVGEILGKLVPGLSPPTQSSSSFGQTLPELESLPQELKAVMLSEPPEGLCQFIWAGLFICHHRYLADLLEAHHNYPERIFWQKVRQAILNYQSRFPNLQARFELFDLLAPSFTKLCLNRNRLLTYGYADDGDRPHAATFGFVSNALHLASVKFEKASESTRS
jgi:hypothetical protein